MFENQKEKVKAINLAVSAIEKQFGKGAIMRLGDSENLPPIDVISTGCFSLDMALGVGGIPRGRIVEVYGPEASGKTTLTLHLVAESQKKGGITAFVDAENNVFVAFQGGMYVSKETYLNAAQKYHYKKSKQEKDLQIFADIEKEID